MDTVLIVFLVLLNGVFAMSEMALASSRKARLAALQEAGDKGASVALALMAQPTQFLSTVQVGITSIGVLNGIVGEAAFSQGLGQWLRTWGLSEGAASLSATAAVVAVITFITIIFGELVPKRIGQLYPETVARWVSRPMATLARVAGPFVKLLSVSTHATLKLLRVNPKHGQAVTEEEIAASLAEGVSAGLIEAHEHQMVRNVFHLDDRPLSSMMTPRSEVVWLDAASTPAQALATVRQLPVHEQHTSYPVCKGGLAHVQGVIALTQLLALSEDEDRAIETFAQPADFVPETLSGMELLERLRDESSRTVFVVDEYGEVQGLVTALDMLQAITGELKSETQNEAWATLREDGSWLLDGVMPVSELKARLQMTSLPAENRGLYNTLAGLLIYVLGQLPKTGETIRLQNWTFEIVDLDGRRIDKVLAHPVAASH